MRRSPVRLASFAGAFGGSSALAILLAGSVVTGQPGFLELVHNGATVFVPLEAFEAGIATFGSFAKGLLFIGVAVALIACRVAERIVLTVFGVGPFGSIYVGDAIALHVPLVAACAGYGAIAVGVLRGAARE